MALRRELCGLWCQRGPQACVWEVLMGPRRATAEHCAQSRLVRSRSRIMPRPVTKQMLLTKHITPIETPPLPLWGLIQSQDGGEQPLFQRLPATSTHTHTYAPRSIRHTDKGGRAAHLRQATWASRQPWAILDKHKLMKNTLSPYAVAQNTETLKWL